MLYGVYELIALIGSSLQWLLTALASVAGVFTGVSSSVPVQSYELFLGSFVAIGAAFTIVKFGIHIVKSFAFGF